MAADGKYLDNNLVKILKTPRHALSISSKNPIQMNNPATVGFLMMCKQKNSAVVRKHLIIQFFKTNRIDHHGYPCWSFYYTSFQNF